MASALIGDLDDALRAVGEDIILRRVVGTAPNQTFIQVRCRAKVSALRDEQISAGITQTDLNFIMSPTQINEAQWPGGTVEQAAPFDQDPRIPRAQADEIICRGKARKITDVQAEIVGGELVRINGRMVG